MKAGSKPGLQAGLGLAEIRAGNRGAGKAKLKRPALDLHHQLLIIEFRMHTPDHTVFTAFLPQEAATLELGAALAHALRPEMTVFLEGDLGAGKTTLTRGILRGLGFTGRVKSPTYTLVESYSVSSLYFYHFDLYRFSDPLEWEDAGFRDYFNPYSICLIEWADKAEDLLPKPDWIIHLTPKGAGREIRIEPFSETGKACLEKFSPPSLT